MPASASAPERTFNFDALDLEHKLEVGLGMKDGDAKIDAAVAGGGKDQNGWRVGGLAAGDRAFFNGDWLSRAGLAKAGIYANDSGRSHVSPHPEGCQRRDA